MRKLLFTLSILFLLTIVARSQAPSFINYQGTARNSVGNALVNKPISLRLSVQDGVIGNIVYRETRQVTTNAFGLFSVQIGDGNATNVSGSLLTTNWAVGAKWIQVEIDPEGGTQFKNLGNTRLTSVPYALYTNLSGDIVLPFNKSQNENGTLFKLTNTGSNAGSLAIEGQSNSTAPNVSAIRGTIASFAAGSFSAAVLGQNNGTSSNGIGVYGRQEGSGWGVYGTTPGGVGVYGNSTTGTGVYGQSVSGTSVMGFQPSNGTGSAGRFQNTGISNSAPVVLVESSGGLADGVQSNMSGFGKAGSFQNTNAANTANVVEAITNGLGRVVALRNTNATNTANVLDVSTNGLGRTAILQNTNAANSANALEVNNAGTGFATSITNTNTTPKALRTQGAIQFTGVSEGVGKVMATVDGTGNATWQSPASVGLVSGSGTLNYVPKWTPDGTIINNSQIFDDGNKMSIAGAVDPVYKLTMNGTMKVKGSSPDSAIAIFENTSTGAKSDGIIIKLNKTHPAWSGSGYLNITNAGAEIFQSQINTIRGWIINHNAFSPNDLYSLAPSSLIAGSAAAIVNVVIDKVNNSLNLPLYFPDVTIPAVVMPSVYLPRLNVCFGDLGCVGVGGFNLNDPITLLPATPILKDFKLLPSIPHIPYGNLPTFSVPNIDFNNVNNSLTNDNHFVSFFDKDNRELGSIRAQSVLDWSANYLDGTYFVKLMSAIVGLDVPQGVAAAVAGFTDIADSYNSIGVEYASGHADYAEWLERIDPSEIINPGDIVGVRGGKVSKHLEGAEQILAVSHNPIVLGNMPTKEKEAYGNKIAFTGQVPVKVVGPVNVGDYIVAKGDIKGYGVAVNPANITTTDLKFTVGRSWETNLSEGPKMVNTLIGIDNGDYIKIMKESQDKITTLEERMKLLEGKMDQLLNVPAKKKNGKRK